MLFTIPLSPSNCLIDSGAHASIHLDIDCVKTCVTISRSSQTAHNQHRPHKQTHHARQPQPTRQAITRAHTTTTSHLRQQHQPPRLTYSPQRNTSPPPSANLPRPFRAGLPSQEKSGGSTPPRPVCTGRSTPATSAPHAALAPPARRTRRTSTGRCRCAVSRGVFVSRILDFAWLCAVPCACSCCARGRGRGAEEDGMR